MRKNAKYLTRTEALAIAKQAYDLGFKNGWDESTFVDYHGQRHLTGNEFTDWVKKEHQNLFTPLTPSK
jgi:hypothetical protein